MRLTSVSQVLRSVEFKKAIETVALNWGMLMVLHYLPKGIAKKAAQ